MVGASSVLSLSAVAPVAGLAQRQTLPRALVEIFLAASLLALVGWLAVALPIRCAPIAGLEQKLLGFTAGQLLTAVEALHSRAHGERLLEALFQAQAARGCFLSRPCFSVRALEASSGPHRPR
jgi:hypothetical protein